MAAVDLVMECKKGLGISQETNEKIDGAIQQKLLAVKSFMLGAGVSEENIKSDLATGAIVLGVNDLWELKTGEVKFSPVFFTLVTQLAGR